MDINVIKANGPFFRGKVLVNVDDRMDGRIGVHISDFHSHLSNDEKLYKGLNLGNIGSPNFVTAYSTLGINKSSNDEKKYQTNSGEYEVPRVGSYVIVFFLNNDPNQCYYLPKKFSLPYPDQRILAMNLSEYNKEDFNDLIRKTNMEVKEFFNGNIIGINNNDDVNEFFLIFDNGTELKVSSPNEKLDENLTYEARKSHRTRNSILQFLIKRKDTLFKSLFKMQSGKDKSEASIGVEKTNIAERGLGINYSDVEETSEQINGQYKIDLTEKSITATNELNFKNGDKTLNFSDNTTQDEFEINNTEKLNYSENNNENYKLEETKVVRKEEIAIGRNIQSNTNLEGKITFLENKQENVNKTIKTTNDSVIIENGDEKKNSMTKTETMSDSETSIVENYTLEEKDGFKNLVIKKVLDEEALIYSMVMQKTFKEDADRRNSLETLYRLKDNDIEIIKTMKNERLETIFSIKGIEETSHEVSISSRFKTPNPGDPSGTLNLPNFSENGYIASLKVAKNETVARLESTQAMNGVEEAAIPTMGMKSYIEWRKTGADSIVTIELKNNNPIGGIKLILSTSDNKVTLELPSGNIDINAPLGDINVNSMNANVKATNSAKVEANLNAEVKALNVKVEASMKAEVTAVITEVKAIAKALIDAPIIQLGNGAVSPLVLGIPFLTWAISHVHMVTSPGSPTSPSIIPPTGVTSIKSFSL